MQDFKSFYMFLSSIFILTITSCDLDKINLDREDDRLIPNYSLTLPLAAASNMQSNILPLDDDTFVLAVQSPENTISVMEIKQSFADEVWSLTHDSITALGEGRLLFFDTTATGYLSSYIAADGFATIKSLDRNYEELVVNDQLEAYIDTTYNDVDSLVLTDFSAIPFSTDYLFSGEVHTQETSFGCILKTTNSLEPIWFRTYFESATVQEVLAINQDTFVVLQTTEEGTDIVRDNDDRLAYQKYDLNTDQLFLGNQAFIVDNKLFFSGVTNNVGQVIEVELSSTSAFVNQTEIYPISNFRAVFLSRDNFIAAGIHGGDDAQFVSELGTLGSSWCHRYTNTRYASILDIVEMPGKGVLVAALAQEADSTFVHLTRIDEEGARFRDEFTENCL